ncbi:hypothetical protein K461DRAFT_324424 [Myriangium duriaei CBS 260.36]|uniref:DUF4267 domain-containing protein n=1 Tax=Myriangium duriaei CBS 260.36 TaxID=1168546 RepID=A0A9P4IV13_9PEZI|nr:hypothetical protein K461DRAFT_324424 [Myriangium duriaei CBS 260.36]
MAILTQGRSRRILITLAFFAATLLFQFGIYGIYDPLSYSLKYGPAMSSKWGTRAMALRAAVNGAMVLFALSIPAYRPAGRILITAMWCSLLDAFACWWGNPVNALGVGDLLPPPPSVSGAIRTISYINSPTPAKLLQHKRIPSPHNNFKTQTQFKSILLKMSDLSTTRVLTILSYSMGALATVGGGYGLLNPVAFGEGFGGAGLRITSAESPAVPFARATAARNFGSGLGILSLLYLGERRAVGTLFMTGTFTALLDAWICWRHVTDGGKAVGHAVMGVLAAALGYSLRTSSTL